MADKHFVVQGALCKCNFGNTPSKLLVSGGDEYINDFSGISKPVAGTKDTGNPFTPGTFGACSITRGVCAPAVIQWLEAYQDITLSNGGHILMENSKATCATAGTPCIRIIHHGQVAALISSNTDENSTVTTTALNPLAMKPVKKLSPVARTISVCLTKRQPSITFSSVPHKDNSIPCIRVRLNEPLLFEVDSYADTTSIDTSLMNWKVFNGHSVNHTSTFEVTSPSLSFSFDKAGDYRVLAYGKDQTDSPAWLDFNAGDNCLKNELVVNDEKDKQPDSFRLKKDAPANIAVIYEIDPATADEKAKVSMQVTDASNNLIATSRKDHISFTPTNAATSYFVQAIMNKATSNQLVRKKFHTESKGPVTIINQESTHLIRPGTNMSFYVSAMKLQKPLPFDVSSTTRWLLNGKQMGIGPFITIEGNIHLTIPGKYVIEAVVDDDGGFSENAKWHFEVKRNEALQIIIPDSNTNWIVGKCYTLSLQTLMDYDEILDGPVIWEPYGASGCEITNASVRAEGRFLITARLGKSKQSIEIMALKAAVERWCFSDQQLIYKSSIGWQEYIHVFILSVAAANEKIPLHLLQVNPANRIYKVKDLGMGNFNATGELKLSINTRELKPLLTNMSFEWDTFRLLFAIPETVDSILFVGMKSITADGKKYWFPQPQSNKRTQEKGTYVRINARKEIVAVQFYDQQNHYAYKVYKYGEQLRMHIQTKNLSGEELVFQIWENKYQSTDKYCFDGKARINEYDTAEVIIDTRRLKAGNIVEDSLLRCFYVILKSSTDKYYFPPDIADKNLLIPDNVSYFQHIKLSNRFDTFLNKQVRANAPVVLGESVEEEVTETGCPRCNKPITTTMLIKVFPRASASSLQTVADTYNRFMVSTGMNTCWNKAHFFAQVAIESGEYLQVKEGESFNWYWEDLGPTFPPFRTTEGKKNALQWGRAVRRPIHPGVTKEDQQNIANYAYSPASSKGKSLGNTQKNDGWTFRGRGLIQLTGRDAYTYANGFTRKENADILLHPDLVATDMKIAALSSMAFWRWKGLHRAANGNTEVTSTISTLVGKDVTVNGKSSHAAKKHVFNTNTSGLFRVKDCLHGKAPVGPMNRYIIQTNTFSYRLIAQNPTSNQYKYDVYLSDALIKTYVLTTNENGLMPFPETGPNWGRYGTRDGGDDNYIAPVIAAPLLGFFYSLPQNGHKDKLYFNDISASDKRNIGHDGHIEGNDIDIRYPGSTDREGAVLWTEAKRAYKDEKEFIRVLENILRVAGKWGFKKNYAYKKSIKNTTGDSIRIHKNHFHIGLR
ncbi:PAAR-like protein [Chitinophaga arvensicola]|uniref:Predicted chitinase n=1 Tax=Chitinophaga arvensicola TaxID=29529 RepID=A0A1I0Q2Z1_9BACT|nr:PAAR-like protein [Chitinophaga arvensicola]SEW21226.1 Predicted chitinase [Chitinophaga arvensicola]